MYVYSGWAIINTALIIICQAKPRRYIYLQRHCLHAVTLLLLLEDEGNNKNRRPRFDFANFLKGYDLIEKGEHFIGTEMSAPTSHTP